MKINLLQWLSVNGLGILAVIFTFGFMIFVHELGHFIAAIRAGMTVHEFALGFGPKLLSFGGNKKKKKEEEDSESLEFRKKSPKEPVKTEYCLRLIPFGGFVSLEGEDEEGDLSDPGNFNNKPVWERLKTILAGCFMNYVAGTIILLLVGFIWGVAIPNQPAVVGNLVADYPLEKAGVKPGDKIVRINQTEIKDFAQLQKIVSSMTHEEEIVIAVERKNKILTFKTNVKLDKNKDTGEERGMLGFMPAPGGLLGFRFEKVSEKMIVKNTFMTVGQLTISPLIMVKMLLDKKVTVTDIKEGSAGPIGISQMIFDISKEGAPSLLYLCAILSILIGAFNLMPFPALDGARAVFLAIEMARKKPINPEIEGKIHQWGFIILLTLVALISLNDIARIIRGDRLLK